MENTEITPRIPHIDFTLADHSRYVADTPGALVVYLARPEAFGKPPMPGQETVAVLSSVNFHGDARATEAVKLKLFISTIHAMMRLGIFFKVLTLAMSMTSEDLLDV